MQTVLCFTVCLCFICPKHAKSQTAFEKALTSKVDSLLAPVVKAPTQTEPQKKPRNELYPNDAMQTVMSPTGWGGFGTYLFGGLGGAYPEVYHSSKPDLITSAGACTGNPIKAVNFAASLNMTDVHRFRNFSGNFILSRMLFRGTSVSIGGLQLFANNNQSDAPGSTYYIAFSHAVQTLLSKTPGCSKLSYTIGIGSGRFLYKSPKDIAAGKGKYGTAVFGSISYELFRHVNVGAEWTGMNLGFSLGIRPFKNALSIGIGAANLTSYSSDKPNMVLSIGYPLSLNR